MSRSAVFRGLLAAALALAASVLFTAPASAARVQLGTLSDTPNTSCSEPSGGLEETCTAIGLRIPAAGKLERLRLKHGAPIKGAPTFTFRVYNRGETPFFTNYGTGMLLGSVAAGSGGGEAVLDLRSAPVDVGADQYIGVTATNGLVNFIDNFGSRAETIYFGTDGDYNDDSTVPNHNDSQNAVLQADVRTPPVTTFTGGPSGSTTDGQPSFSFSADETPASYECRLGGAWAPCSSPYTAPALADGSYAIGVRAKNDLGMVGPEAVRHFTVDRSPPPPPPAPPAWGFGFAGQTWSFADPADSTGSPATDIERVTIAYDRAAGRLGVLVRTYGPMAAGDERIAITLHRSADCSDPDEAYKPAWFMANLSSTKDGIWATENMTASAPAPKRVSADGREQLFVVESPYAVGLDFACLDVQTNTITQDVFDTLTTSLSGKPVGPFPFEPRTVLVALRRELAPAARYLARLTPRRLAARATHTVRMTAPGPGSVGVEWSVPAKVAKRLGAKVRRGERRVTLAVGAKKTARPGQKAKVKVRLNKAGRKMLRKARKVRLTVRHAYLPQGGDRLLQVTRQVQLKR